MRFHSKPVEENGEVPLADEGRLEAVTATWTPPIPTDSSRCYVVSVGCWLSDTQRRAQLSEILGLVEAHGDVVVGQESLALPKPHPRTYLGVGRSAEVAQRAREAGATLVVVDAQLSPSQTRNLEDAMGLSISDREIVILGVFHKHARSRAARIQVEIAQLEYLRPRIRGLGLNMDQQAGGVMNGKGAGETASELMARRLDDRLVVLKRAFGKLESAGRLRRSQRDSCARIALVGYTNAGKTSLMNRLTGSALSTRSRPFETLDTTTRSLTRHGGEVVLGDTVGFIRDLPERLLPSFSSTLAEAREASLLAVVVDLSDPEWPMHLETTQGQLEGVGAGDIPQFLVFNKLDRVSESSAQHAVERVVQGREYALLSCMDSAAVDSLRTALIASVRRATHTRAEVFVGYGNTEVSGAIYRQCRVLEAQAGEGGLTLKIEGPVHIIEDLCRLARRA